MKLNRKRGSEAKYLEEEARYEVAEEDGEDERADHQTQTDAQCAVQLASEFGAHKLVQHCEGIETPLNASFRRRQERRVIGITSSFTVGIRIRTSQVLNIDLNTNISLLFKLALIH